jgi:hypothetical protein
MATVLGARYRTDGIPTDGNCRSGGTDGGYAPPVTAFITGR